MAEVAALQVKKAIRMGMRKPDICEKCGKKFPIGKIHGHHPNYRKPLFVIWVCPKCHRGIHKMLNFLERSFEWLKYCKASKIEPEDGMLPWLHKKSGRPTGLTIYEHWKQNEHRITK